jgi:hypothetical protein
MTQDQIFAYVLVAVVALGVVFALQLCYHSLIRAAGWSLTDALSEEVTLTQLDAQGNPVLAPAAQPAAGVAAPAAAPGATQTVSVTTLKASSSRFIALIGTISILMLYIGFGLASLDRFAMTGIIPDMSTGANFFYAGLVLFAPYMVNKFASAFSFFK